MCSSWDRKWAISHISDYLHNIIISHKILNTSDHAAGCDVTPGLLSSSNDKPYSCPVLPENITSCFQQSTGNGFDTSQCKITLRQREKKMIELWERLSWPKSCNKTQILFSLKLLGQGLKYVLMKMNLSKCWGSSFETSCWKSLCEDRFHSLVLMKGQKSFFFRLLLFLSMKRFPA